MHFFLIFGAWATEYETFSMAVTLEQISMSIPRTINGVYSIKRVLYSIMEMTFNCKKKKIKYSHQFTYCEHIIFSTIGPTYNIAEIFLTFKMALKNILPQYQCFKRHIFTTY